MTHYYNFKKGPRLPSLQELCTRVLIDNRHTLGRSLSGEGVGNGDVGDIPSYHLNPVLSHCSPEDLQRIEDKTMERSGRDIRWDTWQIWKRMYVSKYGKPNPDEVPELRALPDRSVDLDNLPEGLGDYRALYERKVQQTDAQRAKLAEKLRRMKKKEQMSREKTKAKRIDTITPRKPRSRSSTARASLKNSTGVSAQDFFQKLGMSKKSKPIFKRR